MIICSFDHKVISLWEDSWDPDLEDFAIMAMDSIRDSFYVDRGVECLASVNISVPSDLCALSVSHTWADFSHLPLGDYKQAI